jgi:phosphodiesterase/alkaline phosphatase D-like protein
MTTMNRRSFMTGTAAAGGGVLLPPGVASSHARPGTAAAPERAFRFVHFGDTHFGGGPTMPFCASEHGYPKALAHVQAMTDAPEFILHAGDIITDAFWATRESAVAQWRLYTETMRKHCRLPVRYTLGNHDVNFGWDLGDETTPFPGKMLALEQTGLTSPYYSFNHGGWHFIVLDNTQRGGWNGFQHYLDETQFEWLARDLNAAGPATPVVISSHAPILCVTCFFEPPSKQHPDGLVISNDCVHMDVVRLHNLFRRHRNVRLCLSGHYHQVDQVQYLGVHHICGGAVCADYWRRPLTHRPEFEGGYGVVDLFKDGTFEYRYVDYGLVGYQDDPLRERYPWDKA